ncbi:MAG: hypothetical protein H7A46_26555 [Verrucomicrobiales bacterium]|nr:hypothetical protein [Verrucomicrobiales bacterium]
MATDPEEIDAKLQRLGERARMGWAQLHSMTEEARRAVSQAVTDQWQREEAVRQTRQEAREAEAVRRAGGQESQQRDQQKEAERREQDRQRDKGHGHSY